MAGPLDTRDDGELATTEPVAAPAALPTVAPESYQIRPTGRWSELHVTDAGSADRGAVLALLNALPERSLTAFSTPGSPYDAAIEPAMHEAVRHALV